MFKIHIKQKTVSVVYEGIDGEIMYIRNILESRKLVFFFKQKTAYEI